MSRGWDRKLSREEAADLLRRRIGEIDGGFASLVGTTPESEGTVERLDRLATAFEEGLEVSKQGNADRKKQTEEIKRSRGMPAGGG